MSHNLTMPEEIEQILTALKEENVPPENCDEDSEEEVVCELKLV